MTRVVNTVNKFTDVNECIQFMIYFGEFGQTTVFFCNHRVRHEQWAKE